MISRKERWCNFSQCICDNDELWPDPNYEIGQLWKFYGTFDDDITYLIEDVLEEQILLSYSDPDSKVRRYLLAKHYPGHYANIGTPELRNRVG